MRMRKSRLMRERWVLMLRTNNSHKLIALRVVLSIRTSAKLREEAVRDIRTECIQWDFNLKRPTRESTWRTQFISQKCKEIESSYNNKRPQHTTMKMMNSNCLKEPMTNIIFWVKGLWRVENQDKSSEQMLQFTNNRRSIWTLSNHIWWRWIKWTTLWVPLPSITKTKNTSNFITRKDGQPNLRASNSCRLTRMMRMMKRLKKIWAHNTLIPTVERISSIENCLRDFLI